MRRTFADQNVWLRCGAATTADPDIPDSASHGGIRTGLPSPLVAILNTRRADYHDNAVSETDLSSLQRERILRLCAVPIGMPRCDAIVNRNRVNPAMLNPYSI